MESCIYHLHALTAIHAGVGAGAGVIDLPIARERATYLPIIPGASLKGVLREELRDNLPIDLFLALFGPEWQKAEEHAGALAVGDARLLCLPIRSLYGTFAWVTCPLVLRRYQRDLQDTQTSGYPASIPEVVMVQIAVPDKEQSKLARNDMVYLEDLDLTCAETDNAVTEWANFIAKQAFKDADWPTLFSQRFAIVADALFDFLSETALEISARIRLEEGKRTVAKGALWYEENLPAETLLWGIVAADRSRRDKGLARNKTGKELLQELPEERRLQVGGNATVGRGQVRWLLPAFTEVENA